MDKEKIKKAIVELLEAVGENPSRAGLKRTPERVADMLQEILSGKNKDAKSIFHRADELKHDGMVVVKNLRFYSMCEHHFLPFFGVCHIAYVPKNNRITGIGKFAEVLGMMSKKLQVQERLASQIADAVMQELNPKGVGVVMEARHLCMEMICPNQDHREGTVITPAFRGVFKKDARIRQEFLNLIK